MVNKDGAVMHGNNTLFKLCFEIALQPYYDARAKWDDEEDLQGGSKLLVDMKLGVTPTWSHKHLLLVTTANSV